MGRLIKIITWLVAGFVALFTLAAVAIFVFFEPNDFREDIARAVKEATGRELVIDGDIALDLFPWIAIEIGNTSFGNAPGFGAEPMVRFELARLRVRLMPLLLRREITVATAEIESLTLNLQVNALGTGNWESLVPKEASESPDDSAPKNRAMTDIAGLELRNATIRYQDAASGDNYVLSEVQMSLGRISGKDTISIAGLSVEGVLDGVADRPTTFKFRTGGIEIQTVAQVVALQPLELSALGIDITAQVEAFSYAGDITPVASIEIAEFSPGRLMRVFGVDAPETADPAALSRASIAAQVKITGATVELTELQIKLDDTTVRGTLSVPRDAGGVYRFDLVADAIELDRYLQPTAESAGSTGASAPVEIPVDLIKPLHVDGKLRATEVKFAGLVFENVELGVNAAAGRMRLQPISAGFYGGHYSGDVSIDVASTIPVVSLNEKIENVDMAQLAKAMFDQENITGTISGAFKLTTHGNDTLQMQRNLAGNLSFQLQEGTFEGTDVWYELRRARALIKGLEAPQPSLPPRTRFNSVVATGVVKDGIMRNNDLFVELPFMRLTGGGQVDLVAATIDYHLIARVFDRPEMLQNATQEELNAFTQAEIPLRISGSLTSPSVKPDLEKLLRKRIEDEIKDKLKERLKDLFGG